LCGLLERFEEAGFPELKIGKSLLSLSTNSSNPKKGLYFFGIQENS